MINNAKHTSNSAEFLEPQLAVHYDQLCSFGEDKPFFLKQINKLDPKIIIDFGCGTGLLTHKMQNGKRNVIGIEPAKPMLDIARGNYNIPNIDWVLGSTKELASRNADLIVMTSHVAQFIINDEDWVNFLETAYQSLNQDGHILFDSKNPLPRPWEKYTKRNTIKSIQTNNGILTTYAETLTNKTTSNKAVLVTHDIHYHFERDDNRHVSRNTLVYRSQSDIENSLKDAGFNIVNIFGDWTNSEATDQSNELIFLARKE